jgi:hypothetical protein
VLTSLSIWPISSTTGQDIVVVDLADQLRQQRDVVLVDLAHQFR